MAKNKKIEVKGLEVVVYHDKKEDFISLTDIARYKNPKHTDIVIQNWMRSRMTIELLGTWEKMYNENFKLVEFDQFRKEAGLNHFTLSPQNYSWIKNKVEKLIK